MKTYTTYLLLVLSLPTILFAQGMSPGFGGGDSSSCQTSVRKALCWDMSSTPSKYREIEINGCSATCAAPSFPQCIAGNLYGNNCSDGISPAQCFCS
jgi:hypothetical protein